MADEMSMNRQARELYDPRAPHSPGCGGMLSLADELRHKCPHCGADLLRGLVPEPSLDRSAEMLRVLQVRRLELGLTVDDLKAVCDVPGCGAPALPDDIFCAAHRAEEDARPAPAPGAERADGDA